MVNPALLSDLDLAALLCSRVCHDVISPVGAIANGLEVLEEETDDEMRAIAFDLVAKSAKQASSKLQFCRMAFGAAGSAGASIDLGEAGDVAAMFVGDEKVTLDWQAPRINRPKQEVKLLLNMMLIAMTTVPRGGEMVIAADDHSMRAEATGMKARLPENTVAILNGTFDSTAFDARLVQVYYTLRIADDAGFDLELSLEGETAKLLAHRR